MAWKLRNIFKPEINAHPCKDNREEESILNKKRILPNDNPSTLFREILLWKKQWCDRQHMIVDEEQFINQYTDLLPEQEENLRRMFMRVWHETDYELWNHFKQDDEQPDITSIVTVYNVAENIRECVKSIQYQTLTSVEIVIVDDCSPDNSIEVIGDIILKDDRFIYVRALKNRGLLQARHIGGRFARGEYLTFVDGDDFLIPNIYEKSLEKANETKADITQFGMYRLQDDRLFPHDYAVPKHEILLSRDILHKHLTFEINYSMCNKLFRTSMWNSLLKKFPKARYDVEDLSRIGIICLNSYIYAGINEFGYVYRFREESDSQEVTLTQTATRMFSTARHLARLKMELREKNLISLYAAELGDYEALLYRIKPRKFLANTPEKIRPHIKWLKKTYRVNGFMPLNSHLSAFSPLVPLIDKVYSRLIETKDKSYTSIILLADKECNGEDIYNTINNLNNQIVSDITKFEVLLIHEKDKYNIINDIIEKNEYSISIKPIQAPEANLRAVLEYALPLATSQFLILLRAGMELNPRHLSNMLRKRTKHKVNIVLSGSPLPEGKNSIPYTDFPDLLNKSGKVQFYGTLFRTEPMILLRSMFREVSLQDNLIEDTLILAMIILTRGSLAQAGRDYNIKGNTHYNKKTNNLRDNIILLPNTIIEYSNYIQMMRYLANFYTPTRGKNKSLLKSIENYLFKELQQTQSMELLRTLKKSQTMTYYEIVGQISAHIRMDFLEQSLRSPAKSNEIVTSLPQTHTVQTKKNTQAINAPKASKGNKPGNIKRDKIPITVKKGMKTIEKSIEGAGKGIERIIVKAASNQKKFTKYKDDPKGFFLDSKWSMLRAYGEKFYAKNEKK